ncbi:MAG: class I SAM-dependent methyltransferase [Legionellales bacterium]|nr:class I SAM-dependent methyltransferase [Legionellales bacterium]
MSILSWLTAKYYDKIMQDAETKGLKEWRTQLLRHATGTVLEIGAGTGSNLECYPQTIKKLVLLEPSPHMRQQLTLKLSANNAYPIELLDGKAESIPFPDATFDAIVCTLVLCSVKNMGKALSELHRVLAPEGKLIFIEHVAAAKHTTRFKWQKMVEPVWKRMASGCHVTRQTEAALVQAGFMIEDIARQSMRGVPSLVRPTIRGIAIKC